MDDDVTSVWGDPATTPAASTNANLITPSKADNPAAATSPTAGLSHPPDYPPSPKRHLETYLVDHFQPKSGPLPTPAAPTGVSVTSPGVNTSPAVAIMGMGMGVGDDDLGEHVDVAIANAIQLTVSPRTAVTAIVPPVAARDSGPPPTPPVEHQPEQLAQEQVAVKKVSVVVEEEPVVVSEDSKEHRATEQPLVLAAVMEKPVEHQALEPALVGEEPAKNTAPDMAPVPEVPVTHEALPAGRREDASHVAPDPVTPKAPEAHPSTPTPTPVPSTSAPTPQAEPVVAKASQPTSSTSPGRFAPKKEEPVRVAEHIAVWESRAKKNSSESLHTVATAPSTLAVNEAPPASTSGPPPSPHSDAFEDADEDDEWEPPAAAVKPAPSLSSPVMARSGSLSASVFRPMTPASAPSSPLRPPSLSASVLPSSTTPPVPSSPLRQPVATSPARVAPRTVPALTPLTTAAQPTPSAPAQVTHSDEEDHIPLAIVKERNSPSPSGGGPNPFGGPPPLSPLRSAVANVSEEKAPESVVASAAAERRASKIGSLSRKASRNGDVNGAEGDDTKTSAASSSAPTPVTKSPTIPSQTVSTLDDLKEDVKEPTPMSPREVREATTTPPVQNMSRTVSLNKRLNVEEIKAPDSPKSSRWLGNLYNKFQSFLDPELPADWAPPEPGLSKSSSLASINDLEYIQRPGVTFVVPRTADDDYVDGKQLFDSRQYEKAVFKFEQAVAAANHVEAMRLLSECYAPSRLANAFKANDWVKRRLIVLSTPEGMLQHAMFLKKYQNGGKGGIGGAGECIVLVRSAADLGYPPAMNEFGIFLRSVGKAGEAMAWFHKAADAGFVESEEFIAEGYEEGLGVGRDPIAGAAWRARVDKRKEEKEAEIAKLRKEEDEIANRLRADGAKRANERYLQDLRERQKEFDFADKRLVDKPLNSAIRNIEWGFYKDGITQLKALVNQGHGDARDYMDPDKSVISTKYSVAMFHLGQHHSAHADPVAAVKWYRRSAEAGYHESMVTLAAYLIVGKGLESADPGQAMVWLMKAWDVGRNKEASLALGEAFTKGIGVMPDPVKAVKWYTRAWEEGGYAEAAFAVGLAYATGFTPGAVDPSQWSHAGQAPAANPSMSESLDARTVVKKSDVEPAPGAAAVADDAVAGSDVASMRSGSPMPGSPVMRSGSPAPGSPSMALNKSQSSALPSSPVFAPRKILRNMMAVKQDVGAAAIWYRRAADKLHSRASNNLGELYMTGRGVPRDDAIGFSLFRRAALQGLPEAEYNVGRCYREGRGCAPNEDMATSWFLKAEAKGIGEATKALAQTADGRRASAKAAALFEAPK
ncbi:hypothetical protein HK101_007142 [Irineochytrium annulatum]|nr:hypothetical protein HK101_007142 [Irineochytrium annulatum]